MGVPEVVVVLITTAGCDEAERIARELLDRRLIACANVLPEISSFFHWEGRVQTETEALLIMKSTADALPLLTNHVRQSHSYDLPEVLAMTVCGGNADYLAWVAGEVRTDTAEDDA